MFCSGGFLFYAKRHQESPVEGYFPEAYNHINQDLGLNGTYGIKDKIQKLTVAENLTIINRNK